MLSKDLNGGDRSPQRDGDLAVSRHWVNFFGSKVERAPRLPLRLKWDQLVSHILVAIRSHGLIYFFILQTLS